MKSAYPAFGRQEDYRLKVGLRYVVRLYLKKLRASDNSACLECVRPQVQFLAQKVFLFWFGFF